MRAPNKLFKQFFLLFCFSVVSLGALAEGLSAEEIRAALANPARADEDKARDAGRKPAEVLAYLGLQKGMTVLDVGASGGWYTEVFSLAVGEKGKVYAQNSKAFLEYNDGFYAKAISEKLKAKHLTNVTRLDAEFGELGIDGTVDIALTALNLHDIYNTSPDAALAMLVGVKKALKPGAVFAVIDHEGDADADNAALHRMTSQQAIELAEKAGYEVDVSNLLRNDADDHTKNVFAPDIRGKTDRFLLKLIKPE
jgi:predicted methyltransferase